MDVAVYDRFDVRPDRRLRINDFTQMELIQYSRLARIVQTDDTDLELWEGE